MPVVLATGTRAITGDAQSRAHLTRVFVRSEGRSTRLHMANETNKGIGAAFNTASWSSQINAMSFGAVDIVAELRRRNTLCLLI